MSNHLTMEHIPVGEELDLDIGGAWSPESPNFAATFLCPGLVTLKGLSTFEPHLPPTWC